MFRTFAREISGGNCTFLIQNWLRIVCHERETVAPANE
jgi:hypothetical protein